MRLPTYAFLDVVGTLTGPGGVVSIGSGSGNAKEGITVEFTEDKDRLLIGADGSSMHSLIASKAGRVLVRLLKTSPINSLLQGLYNFQTTSSIFHGHNTLVISNFVTGDDYTCQEVAFARFPRNEYAEEGGMIEWDFNAAVIDPILGAGVPSLIAAIGAAL